MSSYQIPNINNRLPSLVDAGFYADIRFDADSSAPVYVGMNIYTNTSDDDITWKLYKFTYSGSSISRVQLAYGSWTNRALYF